MWASPKDSQQLRNRLLQCCLPCNQIKIQPVSKSTKTRRFSNPKLLTIKRNWGPLCLMISQISNSTFISITCRPLLTQHSSLRALRPSSVRSQQGQLNLRSRNHPRFLSNSKQNHHPSPNRTPNFKLKIRQCQMYTTAIFSLPCSTNWPSIKPHCKLNPSRCHPSSVRGSTRL